MKATPWYAKAALAVALAASVTAGCGVEDAATVEEAPASTQKAPTSAAKTSESAETEQSVSVPGPEAERCGRCYPSTRCSSRRVRDCCTAGPGTCYPVCC